MFAPLGKYLPSFVSPPPKAVQFSSLTPNSKGESFHLCKNLLLFLKSHLEVFTKNSLTSEPFHKKGIAQLNLSVLSLLASIKKMRHLGL